MKKCFFLFFVFLLFSNLAFSAELTFNFDDNSVCDLNDLVYFISWIQSGYSNQSSKVLARAQEILSSASGPLVRLPNNSMDDLNGDNVADLNDLVMMIAWIQSGNSNVFSKVEGRALEILSTAGRLSKLPGTPIGDSSFSTTITGIQTD